MPAQLVAAANPLGGAPLQTYDGTPQGDPLSMLIFAAAMIELIISAFSEKWHFEQISNFLLSKWGLCWGY